MAESNALVGPGALGIHSPVLTGQSMGHFRDPVSIDEPSRNFISQIHFDIEAPRMSGGLNNVGSLAEAGRSQVPTNRRFSIVVPNDFPADSRGEHQPRAQSTRFPISPSSFTQ